MSRQSTSRSPPRRATNIAEVIATRLRDDIVQAVVDGHWAVLRLFPRRALKLAVDRQILEDTGLGILLADRSLWALTNDHSTIQQAEVVAKSWRGLHLPREVPLDVAVLRPGRKVAAPLAGLRARAFLDRVRGIASEICAQHPSAAAGTINEVAVALVLWGFSEVSQLGGLCPAETSAWMRKPLAASVLSAVTHEASVKCERLRAM